MLFVNCIKNTLIKPQMNISKREHPSRSKKPCNSTWNNCFFAHVTKVILFLNLQYDVYFSNPFISYETVLIR